MKINSGSINQVVFEREKKKTFEHSLHAPRYTCGWNVVGQKKIYSAALKHGVPNV